MCDCKTERRTQDKKQHSKVNRERERKDRCLSSACLTGCVGPPGKHRFPVIPVREAARKNLDLAFSGCQGERNGTYPGCDSELGGFPGE